MASAIVFKNFTSEDFSHTWDKIQYDFPAGVSMMLPEYLAHHFAKHLCIRELMRVGKIFNMEQVEIMKAQCFAGTETKKVEAVTPQKLEVEMMNQEAEKPMEKPVEKVEEVKAKFCDSCDSKGVRHKNACPKNPRATSEVPAA